MISKKELKRQIMHIVLGVVFIILLYFNILNEFYVFLILLLTLLFSNILRNHKIPLVSFFLHHCERKKDMKEMPMKGTIFGLMGVLLAIVIFPKNIALASITILTLGDSIGPLIGQFGKIKHPLNSKKYFEGLFAGIIFSFAGAIIFVPWIHALTASIIAMLAESFDEIKGMPINDNIIVPLVAGIVLSLF